MNKITTTLAGFALALTGAACTVAPADNPNAVPVVIAPAPTTAPATTAPATTLPDWVTTAPAPAPAPTESWGDADQNDGTLSDLEYEAATLTLNGLGLDIASQGTSEELGAMFCEVAHNSFTQDEFLTALTLAAAGSVYTDTEVAYLAGTFMTFMCHDEGELLGLW